MVQAAHEIRLETIPPMVQLAATQEDAAANGKDYFEPFPLTEKLGDTPCVIARICRSKRFAHRIVVSAEKSYDLNKRPLTFQWVVLRGDASRITLKPQNPEASVAEIVVPWHERRPVAEGSPIESNRVDIGVFVHNGAYWSAPGFVTFYFLDDEARTYDESGRVLEIGYGAGEMRVSIPQWTALLDLFKPDSTSLGAQLLKKAFKPETLAAILQCREEHAAAYAGVEAALGRWNEAGAGRAKTGAALKDAEAKLAQAKADHEKAPTDETKAAMAKAEADLEEARKASKDSDGNIDAAGKALEAAKKAAADVLGKKRDPLRAPAKDAVEGVLGGMVRNPGFYAENAKVIGELLRDEGRKASFMAARKRFVGFGLFKDAPGTDIALETLRGGSAADPQKLTRFEKTLLEQFNGELLNRLLYPGVVNCSYARNFVDPRLASPKSWRDVYRYDPQGDLLGWARWDGERKAEFTPDGLQVLETDTRGRCLKAAKVRYQQDNPAKDGRRVIVFPNPNPVKAVATGEVVSYEYSGDSDLKGRVQPAGA
jgi:hypothetical protein